MSFFGWNELYHDTKEGSGHLLSQSCMSELSSPLSLKLFKTKHKITGHSEGFKVPLNFRYPQVSNVSRSPRGMSPLKSKISPHMYSLKLSTITEDWLRSYILWSLLMNLLRGTWESPTSFSF